MELNLGGKTALVTGAGSPIGSGRGIALTLAKYGCDIISYDINGEFVRETASKVEALGCQVMAIQADVTRVAEVKDMVKAAPDKFGKIYILINNAGRIAG